MSNLCNDVVVEALVDEYFDDIAYAVEWLERQGVDTNSLSDDELVDVYVAISMDARG